MHRVMGVDIETYSSVDLAEAGVYAYVEAPDFDILLISYIFDDWGEDDVKTMGTLFGETAFVFSELIRTAFIPSEGCRFVVSDFSAIEARVLAWIAGEEWTLEAFRQPP